MVTNKVQFLIGACSSGGGKTTLSAGLMRAFSDRGREVQPYKCGPDYIDPFYHEMAAGRCSANLDLWFASPGHLRSVYRKYGLDAGVCIAEGVMGLFDGYAGRLGSSAEVALALGLPVVLLLDASAAAYSVAPVLYGFKRFDPSLDIAGVIFNRVVSEKHYRCLLDAADDVGVTSFGYLPAMKSLEVPSRHLGLTLESRETMERVVASVAKAVEEHVDLDLLERTCLLPFVERAEPAVRQGNLKIAVARDDAFNFIYRENIARLEELGTVSFFSPLADSELPEADLLYLPGGYPEFHLKALSENGVMRSAIRDYARSGGRLLAECGGMMYLCRHITGMDGRDYPMADILPLDATMEGMRLHLGYRRVALGNTVYRGHEFHYSSVRGEMPSVARLSDAAGNTVGTPMYRYKNTIAGYTHLYWGESDILKLWE